MLRAMLQTFPFRSSTLAILAMLLASPELTAQWIKYPTAGVPRKPDGSVNMSATAPRLADGKPDLSGIWTTGETNRPTGNLSSPREQGGPPNPQDAKEADSPADPTAIRASR